MKPGGESHSEAAKPTGRLLTKTTRIGIWNVRTMFETGKIFQVAAERKRYNIDILGLSETRWNKTGKRRLATGELFIYSGNLDDSTGHTKGVGLMLAGPARKALITWQGHGPRLITASFKTGNKGINMNVIQCYAPTNDAEEADKDEFYNQLQSILEQCPAKDVNILMGDMNAKVGMDNTGLDDVMGKHGLGVANDNGERFKNLCAMNSLVIGGTVYPHKRIHKATWISPDHTTENQIDHMCISRKFRRTMEDVRVYRGADVASDHHLVMGKFKLKLKKTSPRDHQEKRLKFNTQLLKDKAVHERFNVALKNKFQVLSELLDKEEVGIEEHWSTVRDIYNTTCEEELGQKKHQHKEWISKESVDKVQVRRTKKGKLNACKTRVTKAAAHEEYKQASNEAKKSLREDKRKFTESLAETAEEAMIHGDMKRVYETTRKLCGKYSSPEVPVRDKDGKRLTGQDAQLDRWAQHFQELLNRPAPEQPPDIPTADADLDICSDPPTKEEVKQALAQLRNGKAAGPDYVTADVLKANKEATVDILHPLFEKIWDKGEFPKDWKEGHLIKLPKKGDLSNCKNYRGITLLSIAGKVFNRIILERMKKVVDPHLRDNQAGFRKNRSCIDQIATLRIIAEQSLEWNSPLLINFVDYEKAFDSIHRGTLWKILRHYGIPEKLVSLIQEYYRDTSCRVIHEGQFTKSFQIHTGVKQGCILSPFLFLLTIDWIMKTTTEHRKTGIQWTLWTQLEDLDFADDLALLSHSHQQMRQKTKDLVNISQKTGLKVHSDKTKILKINTTIQEQITVNEAPLEEVDSFTYLGSIIDKKGGTDADVKARIGKARGAFTQLTNVWKSGSIGTKTKIRIFNTSVKSVLLYGSETWRLTKQTTNKLQAFVNSCLRKILKIRWPDTIRNEQLWEQTNQQRIEIEIRRRKWKWIGHTFRKPKTNITHQALKWNPQGKRNRGRPKSTWKRDLDSDLKEMGHSWTEVETIAQDRSRWRALVGGLYSGTG